MPAVLADLGVETAPVLPALLTDRLDSRPELGVELGQVPRGARRSYYRTARTVQLTAGADRPKRVLAFGETSKRRMDGSPPKRSIDLRMPEVSASLPVRL